MKYLSIILLIIIAVPVVAQPTVSTDPASFTAEDEVTVTVDVTGTSLEGYTGDVWIWTWVSEGCSSNCDAPTNIDPAGGEDTADAKVTRDDSNPNVYTFTFVPVDFFGKSPSELKQLGFKLKSQSWGDNKQSDNDAFLTLEPLTFTPTIDRKFPTKATNEDIVTLYLDQNLAEDLDLKYELSDFSVTINALDASGAILETITKDAVNQGDGVHYVRLLSTFDFTTTEEVTSISYQFVSKSNEEVASEEFSMEFLELK